jgi:hypothetical protein
VAFDAKIRLSSDTSRVDAGIAGLQRKLVGLGTAVAGLFAVGTITAAIKNMVDFADAIQDGADVIGTTIEDYQTLKTAAELAGKGVDIFDKAFKNIRKSQQDAVNGNKDAIDTFKRLGISMDMVRHAQPLELLKAAFTRSAGMDITNRRLTLGELVGDKNVGGILASMPNVMTPPISPVSAEHINAIADAKDKLTIFTNRLRNEALPMLATLATQFIDMLNVISDNVEVMLVYIKGLFADFINSPIAKAYAKILNGDIGGGIKAAVTTTGKNFLETYMMFGRTAEAMGKNVPAGFKNTFEVFSGRKTLLNGITDYVDIALGSVGAGFKSLKDVTAKNIIENTFGEKAVETAGLSATLRARQLAEMRMKERETSAQLRKEREDAANALKSNVNILPTKKQKTIKEMFGGEISGGPSALTYGGLIGINAQYRLERMSLETNEWLSKMYDKLDSIDKKTGSTESGVPEQ